MVQNGEYGGENPMMYGGFKHTVEKKGRIFIPAK